MPSRATPLTRCLQCGTTYREARSEQQKYGSSSCATVDYFGEVDREYPKHVWKEPVAAPIEHVIADVVEALSRNEHTDDIAKTHGIKYDSLRERLRGSGVYPALLAKRQQEWDDRRYSRF